MPCSRPYFDVLTMSESAAAAREISTCTDVIGAAGHYCGGTEVGQRDGAPVEEEVSWMMVTSIV